MSTLFLANVSKHRHLFQCRLPESNKPWQVELTPMSQERVGGDMTLEEIGFLLSHNVKHYGLIPASEARKSKNFVGLCYSIDNPVKLDTFFETQETNDSALNKQAQDIQLDQAAAIMKKMRDDGIKVESVEIETVETPKGGGTPKIAIGSEAVSEGVQPRHPEAKKKVMK